MTQRSSQDALPTYRVIRTTEPNEGKQGPTYAGGGLRGST